MSSAGHVGETPASVQSDYGMILGYWARLK